MPTKTKTATRRKRVTVKKTAAAPAARVADVLVHVHPKKAEFFLAGETEPYSRLANGPRNSDAFAQLVRTVISVRETGAAVSLRFFDSQCREVLETEQTEALSSLV